MALDYQKTFDTVARALLRQGRPSLDANLCKYRGQGGAKCAIGHLIPDDKYNPEWDTTSVFIGNLTRSEPIFEVIGAAESDRDFLIALQDAHDTLTGNWLYSWRMEMRTVASLFRLSPAVLVEAQS